MAYALQSLARTLTLYYTPFEDTPEQVSRFTLEGLHDDSAWDVREQHERMCRAVFVFLLELFVKNDIRSAKEIRETILKLDVQEPGVYCDPGFIEHLKNEENFRFVPELGGGWALEN